MDAQEIQDKILNVVGFLKLQLNKVRAVDNEEQYKVLFTVVCERDEFNVLKEMLRRIGVWIDFRYQCFNCDRNVYDCVASFEEVV